MSKITKCYSSLDDGKTFFYALFPKFKEVECDIEDEKGEIKPGKTFLDTEQKVSDYFGDGEWCWIEVMEDAEIQQKHVRAFEQKMMVLKDGSFVRDPTLYNAAIVDSFVIKWKVLGNQPKTMEGYLELPRRVGQTFTSIVEATVSIQQDFFKPKNKLRINTKG